jgi:hypothetical protein
LRESNPDPRRKPPSPAPEGVERPAWAAATTILVAEVEDIVARRTFRVWFDGDEAARPVDGLRRDRRRPFRIEQTDSAREVGAFTAWEEVDAWRERTVISPGWRIVTPLSEVGERTTAPPDDVPPSIAEPQSPT